MPKRALNLTFLILWSLAVLLGITFRTMQLFRVVDMSTGFYQGWDISLMLLDLVLIAAVFFTVICSFLLRKTHFRAIISTRPFLSGLISLLCAVGICCTDITLIFQAEGLSLPYTISLVLSVAAMAAFVVFAFRLFTEKRSIFSLWQTVVITLWGCVEVFSIFIDDSSRSNTSEYVIVISTLCLMILFFLKLGRRKLYPQETKGVSFLLIGCSALTSILGLSISLPNFIAVFFGLGTWSDFLPISIALLPISIFAAGFFFTNCLSQVKKRI